MEYTKYDALLLKRRSIFWPDSLLLGGGWNNILDNWGRKQLLDEEKFPDFLKFKWKYFPVSWLFLSSAYFSQLFPNLPPIFPYFTHFTIFPIFLHRAPETCSRKNGGENTAPKVEVGKEKASLARILTNLLKCSK